MNLIEARSPHIELRSVSKRYGGVQALDAVSLRVGQGEIHALVGENGAGKSTLGKVIAGSVMPDAGAIWLEGQPVHFRSPRDAIECGVTAIDQELALIPMRSVMENVFLGSEERRLGFVQRGRLRERFAALNESSGFGLDPDQPVGSLRTAEQQKVEILRALSRDTRLIVMDEPTASLTHEEASKLFQIIERLRAAGTTIVYISHLLPEVLALADVVSVLKDGRLVRTASAESESPESLVTAMLGRSLDVTFPEKTPPPPDAPVVLSVRGLTRIGAIDDVELSVRAGEIVGLAGLIGSGRSEVARALFGADPRDAGTIELDGRPVRIRKPRDAVRNGIVLLPEDRKTQGLFMIRPVVENLTISHLTEVSSATFVQRRPEKSRAGELVRRFDIRTASLGAEVSTLSGGNQQRVLFAKWLMKTPRVFIADEPTRGVDIGAKRAIYQLIQSLAASGMAVLMISSELEEILGLAHRILVMQGGRIVAELGGDASEEAVMRAAFVAR